MLLEFKILTVRKSNTYSRQTIRNFKLKKNPLYYKEIENFAS